MLFLSVRGFFDYAGSAGHSRSSVAHRVAFLSRDGVSTPLKVFSKLNSPAHRYPCLRFERNLTASPARLRAKMESLFSFLVGLFHPLVGSRTGAPFHRFSLSVAPRFLWECLTNRTVNPFPVPASSNPAGGFPALGFPACFSSRLCGRFSLEGLSLVAPNATLDIH